MYRQDSRISAVHSASAKISNIRKGRTSPFRIDALEPRAYLSGAIGTIAEYPGVTSPTAVVVGDFNDDGQPDLAVAGIDPNTGVPTVAIYLNANGTFPNTPSYNDLPGAHSAFALATTDVNSGSNTDLVVTDPVDGTVLTLLGNGNGTFAAPISSTYGTPQPANSSPVAYVVAGPFSTGYPMLIVTDPGDHQIVPLTSNGDGTYSPGMIITSTDPTFSPQHIVAADFNQDGHYDIAFGDGTKPQVFEANGGGNGGFSSATPADVAGAVQGLVAANLTTDGGADLVATTSGGGPTDIISVLLNTGAGPSPPPARWRPLSPTPVR